MDWRGYFFTAAGGSANGGGSRSGCGRNNLAGRARGPRIRRRCKLQPMESEGKGWRGYAKRQEYIYEHSSTLQ
eukprot:8487874-Pyramimonas_sp.AAC.1